MRFAVWRALKEVAPVGVDYKLHVYYIDNSGYYTCSRALDTDYMKFSYTIGILISMKSKVTCKWQPVYMILEIGEYDTPAGHVYKKYYYWSYLSLSFFEFGESLFFY